MASLAVSIDISGYLQEVDEARNKDIPFATALALTNTARDGQIEVKRNVRRLFTNRNTWTVDGIKYSPAEKVSWPITAMVFTDTGNAAAPDYLLGQENSELKIPHNGHSHVAVPTLVLRSLIGERNVIPAALRPQELLSTFDAMHTSVRTKSLVRTPKKFQYVGFIQTWKGRDYIFARPAGNNRAKPLPLYLLIAETHVKAILGAEDTVQQIANQRFEQNWDDAWNSINR